MLLSKLILKYCIFYGTYLVFPFLVWGAWRLWRGKRSPASICMLVIGVLLVWARFIEPQQLSVRETTISDVGIRAEFALVSDLHLGVYKNRDFLERVVDKINELPIEYVLFAGDFIYEASAVELEALLSPLTKVKVPIYAVLGNHDAPRGSPEVAPALRRALTKMNVHLIEKKVIFRSGYRIAGLEDNWTGDDSADFLTKLSVSEPTIILMHNPDSAMKLSPSLAKIAFAGHTHCGQVRIPGLYKRMIPSLYGFDCGLETAKTPTGALKVFVSRGLGEIGLPLRLFNPPSIEHIIVR